MSEPKPVYRTKKDDAPTAARIAPAYAKVLQDLRDLQAACTEIADDRDGLILQVNDLRAEAERLRKQLARLRGEPVAKSTPTPEAVKKASVPRKG